VIRTKIRPPTLRCRLLGGRLLKRERWGTPVLYRAEVTTYSISYGAMWAMRPGNAVRHRARRRNEPKPVSVRCLSYSTNFPEEDFWPGTTFTSGGALT
jgi:hypothetical protein